MYKHSTWFASGDRCDYITGLQEFVEYWMQQGFSAYQLTFMFKLRLLDASNRWSQIASEIERVYSRFITEVVREPNKKKNRYRRPILIGCMDFPVYKGPIRRQLIMLPHEGVHAGSLLLVPPKNRLKVGVKDHFETDKQDAYIQRGLPLSRIHVQAITWNAAYATDYVFKALKKGRCSPDDLIVLPWTQEDARSRARTS